MVVNFMCILRAWNLGNCIVRLGNVRESRGLERSGFLPAQWLRKWDSIMKVFSGIWKHFHLSQRLPYRRVKGNRSLVKLKYDWLLGTSTRLWLLFDYLYMSQIFLLWMILTRHGTWYEDYRIYIEHNIRHIIARPRV